jgi:hypothetical protein
VLENLLRLHRFLLSGRSVGRVRGKQRCEAPRLNSRRHRRWVGRVMVEAIWLGPPAARGRGRSADGPAQRSPPPAPDPPAGIGIISAASRERFEAPGAVCDGLAVAATPPPLPASRPSTSCGAASGKILFAGLRCAPGHGESRICSVRIVAMGSRWHRDPISGSEKREAPRQEPRRSLEN